MDETVRALPVLATYLGVPGLDHEWNDFSVEGKEAEAELYRDQLRRLEGMGSAGDDQWVALATRVVGEALHRELAELEAGEHLIDLNSIASTLQNLREVFDHMDTSGSEGWENITERLNGLTKAAADYRDRLEAGRVCGEVVAVRQVDEAVRQARNHAAADGFFAGLPAAAEQAGVDPAPVTAGTAVAREAFSALADYLEQDYRDSARSGDAVGRERYLRSARRFLGTDLDPVETYEWGWDEVVRLLGRMSEVAEQIEPGSGVFGALEILQTDPGRASSSQEEFRRLMTERLEVALSDLGGTHFEVPPEIEAVDVKLAPPGGSLGAYYVDPSEDYTRPGSVWWSLGDKERIPLFDQISTAYHEGFPGHHLQVGLQMTAGDRFTRYQRLLTWSPGTGEGWALYAEDLMEELGYLEKPDYVMGKLASEMLRACRVVIDIGSHLELAIPEGQPFHPGEPWTFDNGVEMLDSYAGQDHDVSVSEMNRYLGWPGQAIAYKVGQRVIRDLRSEASARPGYDQKAFHARMLEIGSTGIDVLVEHMRTG